METIHDHITEIHNRIARQVPGFTAINFATITDDNGQPSMYGYVHTDRAHIFHSITELKTLVHKLKPYERPKTYFCVSNGIEYCYTLNPGLGSIDLEGGIPVDEMEIMQVKADCLADYEKRIAEKVENHGENLGLDRELRRVG